MMNSLGWKPLAERRRELRLTLLFKILNDLVVLPTDPLDLYLNPRKQRKSNSKALNYIHCNTDIFKNSFVPKTIKDWNSLADQCVTAKSLSQFKSELSILNPSSAQRD